VDGTAPTAGVTVLSSNGTVTSIHVTPVADAAAGDTAQVKIEMPAKIEMPTKIEDPLAAGLGGLCPRHGITVYSVHPPKSWSATW